MHGFWVVFTSLSKNFTLDTAPGLVQGSVLSWLHQLHT